MEGSGGFKWSTHTIEALAESCKRRSEDPHLTTDARQAYLQRYVYLRAAAEVKVKLPESTEAPY